MSPIKSIQIQHKTTFYSSVFARFIFWSWEKFLFFSVFGWFLLVLCGIFFYEETLAEDAWLTMEEPCWKIVRFQTLQRL